MYLYSSMHEHLWMLPHVYGHLPCFVALKLRCAEVVQQTSKVDDTVIPSLFATLNRAFCAVPITIPAVLVLTLPAIP